MLPKVPKADPISGKKLDNLAFEVIKFFQPGAVSKAQPFDIERFFDVTLEDICGVKSGYEKLPSGLCGYTDSDEMISMVSLDLVEDPFQWRYYRSTQAHETCHALKHVPEFRKKRMLMKSFQQKGEEQSLKLYHQKIIKVYENPEWQAWRMAGALLIPTQPFIEEINKGRTIVELADTFDVNPAFIKTRARQLKIDIQK